MKSYSLAVHYEAFAFLIGTFQPVNGEPAAVTEDLHHTKAVCFRSSGQWGHGDRIIQSCGGIMVKAIFFDIDGTILSHRIKDVPISTRQALCQLSDIHVDRVIATGRHSTEIDRLPVNDIKFDAYITLNGQLCYDLKDNVFYENPIKETGEILKFFHSSTDDIEMLRYVQEGIAMGNADDFVKSVADCVTADIDDNGIEKGLHYLGLL